MAAARVCEHIAARLIHVEEIHIGGLLVAAAADRVLLAELCTRMGTNEFDSYMALVN